jgi:hypothetical protein
MELWLIAAQRAVKGSGDMAKLQDLIRKEDLEGFWTYRHGREEAVQSILTTLVCEKFGELPPWAQEKLRAFKTPEEAEDVLRRLPTASGLEELLG